MTPFLKQIKSQGWKLHEIGKIRGIGRTQQAALSKAPTQWDWLALKGLGDKRVDTIGISDSPEEIQATVYPHGAPKVTVIPDDFRDKREEEG